MSENTKQETTHRLFLGNIEPQAGLLNAPPDSQLLYKIVSVENLLHSIRDNYLHFNRVDCYRDFHGADSCDGSQLPKDYEVNAGVKFANSPDLSAASYYDLSRARTYACCFSLSNSAYIWKNYANASERGKVCLVFNFGKLREVINKTLQPGKAWLFYNGIQCHQLFSVNYGVVEYVEFSIHQANKERLPNPIKYTYIKDKRFEDENEMRISLSALGIGTFALTDRTMMDFPDNVQLSFDFKSAIADQTIHQMLVQPETDTKFLMAELKKLGIKLSQE
jgi:hypothetical protein